MKAVDREINKCCSRQLQAGINTLQRERSLAEPGTIEQGTSESERQSLREKEKR